VERAHTARAADAAAGTEIVIMSIMLPPAAALQGTKRAFDCVRLRAG